MYPHRCSVPLTHTPPTLQTYLRWMSHPLVQEIVTIMKTHFRFKDPKHWATGKEFSSHAKWDIKFLIVANTAGLQQFVKQETLQAALAHASTLLRHPRPAQNCCDCCQQPARTVPPSRLCKSYKGYEHTLDICRIAYSGNFAANTTHKCCQRN